MGAIAVVGTFRRSPGFDGPAQLDAMNAMASASRAETGCLAFRYGFDVGDPSIVVVSELWADRASFEAHLGSEHRARWRGAWEKLGLSLADLRVLDGAVEAF